MAAATIPSGISFAAAERLSSPIYRCSSKRFKSTSNRVVTRRSSLRTTEPLEDYYSLLGLQPNATPEEIKKAYYACMKVCHPDLIGDEVGATNFCMFVNEVYEVLSDPEQRMLYDELNGFSLTSINPFEDRKCTKDRVFVDEFSCIGKGLPFSFWYVHIPHTGCKNCSHTAPCSFGMEEDFGRARVISQNGDRESVQTAIETCPVDCIHWVSGRQLALLEDEMRGVERVNVGVMLSGMGHQSRDVFESASSRWYKKQKVARERARAKIMQENGIAFSVPWWQAMWTPQADSDVSERTNRTAAAAKRWQQYSRPTNARTHKLPQPRENDIN